MITQTQRKHKLKFSPATLGKGANSSEKLYTPDQWRQLFSAIASSTKDEKTELVKHYNTSVYAVRKYGKKLKRASSQPVDNILSFESSQPDPLKKPYKPLTLTKNNILSKLETQADAKRQELQHIENAIAAIEAIDDVGVEAIKAMLAS